ncbi:unnamed protein product [Urochloa humidicola]
MALWNGVGQVASVAQLAGVDANGMIKMIVEAVQTVRRNKKTCQKLVQRIEMINDLLQQFPDAQLMQHHDTRNPVEQLEETLQRAYMLIISCRDSSFMYNCFAGANKAEQFRELENDITFYLQLFSLVGYVDITRTLVHHLNGGQPSQTQESVGDVQMINDHSGHVLRHECTTESVESRLQGIRSELFYEPQKRKLKGQSVVSKDIIKFFYAERHSGLLLFNFSQIVDFTANFKWENVVGRGAFGYVYKGKLPGGIEIAVKRLAATSAQGLQEFTAEIQMIANIQHKNVVRLLGFCIQREKEFLRFHIQREEMIIVYEYMPKKSLASFLYSYTKTRESLHWSKRIHIIEGIAQGLDYLHERSHQCVVHMDLKASNVLLDYEMNPKISDFGMARILASGETEETSDIIKGTNGYMDPKYAESGKFSVKSDVYSFGIMILEIVSRKRCLHLLSNGNMVYLPTYAWELWKAGKSQELSDSSPDVLLMLRSKSAVLPVPKMPDNHTNEGLPDILTLERLWEANVPLQLHPH